MTMGWNAAATLLCTRDSASLASVTLRLPTAIACDLTDRPCILCEGQGVRCYRSVGS